MFKAFKNRRPWVAAVISLFIGPWLGMAFLNRGRWALIYLFALILFIVSVVVLLPASFLPGGDFLKNVLQNANAVIAIAGAVHAYILARRRNPEEKLAWYSRRWYLIAGVPVGLIVLLLVLRTFIYQPFNIPSASMFPAAGVSDAILVSKSAYNGSDPERGDAVVFWAPEFHYHFLKRIVGVPGDHVQMKGGRLLLNGVQLPVRRIGNYSGSCDTGFGCSVPQYEETYPGGRVVRILDGNPTGPLDTTEIFNVPPGFYFVVGDNRDNSSDSRDTVGLVPRNAITGRAAFKYINHGHWTWQRIN